MIGSWILLAQRIIIAHQYEHDMLPNLWFLSSGTRYHLTLKILCLSIPLLSGFGRLVLTSGTQDRGFAPGRSRRIFRAKNPQHAFLRKESKAVFPMSQILKWRKKASFRQNYRTFSPKVPPFATRSARVDGDV
jgi:hypothetical protein